MWNNDAPCCICDVTKVERSLGRHFFASSCSRERNILLLVLRAIAFHWNPQIKWEDRQGAVKTLFPLVKVHFVFTLDLSFRSFCWQCLYFYFFVPTRNTNVVPFLAREIPSPCPCLEICGSARGTFARSVLFDRIKKCNWRSDLSSFSSPQSNLCLGVRTSLRVRKQIRKI